MTDCPACDLEHARGSAACPGQRVGTVFHGKYDLVRILGCGGMGAVYEAVHRGLGRSCAVKVMLASAHAHAGLAARFEQEARRIATLEHAGIVKIYDAGRDANGELFIEMELLRGQSLETWAQAQPAPAACVDVIARALAALAEAHDRGIIHRDLKPENIFLAGERVVLLDFGIARDTGSVQYTQPGSVMGTLVYMSPEQLVDSASVDARTDVFAMAATLFRLLVGTPPVHGSRGEVIGQLASRSYRRSARAAGAGVSAALDAAIAEALDPDRERRPRDAGAFRERLLAATGEPSATLPLGSSTAPVLGPLDGDRGPPASASAPVAATVPLASASTLPSASGSLAARPAATLPSASGSVAAAVATPTSGSVAAPLSSGSQPTGRRSRVWVPVVAVAGVVAIAVPIAVLALRGSSDRTPRDAAVTIDADAARVSIDAGPAAPRPDMARIPGAAIDTADDIAAFRAWCPEVEHDRAVCDELLARITPGRVAVATFDLDREEVTRGELAAWLASARVAGTQLVDAAGQPLAFPACHPVNGMAIRDGRVVVVRDPDVAAACVTHAAAVAYCAAHGKRLPTGAEWTLAAGGAPRRVLPWPGRAVHCGDAVFGRARPEGTCKEPEGPDRARLDNLDVTAEGVRALGGNVSEWVDEPAPAGRHVARGGSWAGGAADLHPAKLMLVGDDGRGFAGATTIGFRCALTPGKG